MRSEQEKTNPAWHLKSLIDRIGAEPEAELVRSFLAFNNHEELPDELRSLALDAMLVAEGDTNGEFRSKKELLERLQEFTKKLGRN